MANVGFRPIAGIVRMADGVGVKPAITVALSLCAVSCAPLSAGEQYFGQALPVCSILADVDRYADQRVLVRGLYNSTPHQGSIYDPEDPECRSVPLSFSPDRPRNSRASQVIRAAFVRNEFARVPIVVSGVVRPSVRQENGQQVVYVSCPCIEEAVTVAARQP